MTLRRAAERLSVTKPVCWALTDEQATVEREEQVEANGRAVAAAAGTDPRVEQAAAEASGLIDGGMPRLIAIHRVCRGDRKLEARLLKKEGFQKTDVRGRWRNNSSQIVEFIIWRLETEADGIVIIPTIPTDYAVFIK